MLILRKANKNKNCSKCDAEIKKGDEYRIRLTKNGKNENFCVWCFAFLVTHYSFYDDWKKYQFSEKEKLLIKELEQKMFCV